MRAPTVSMTARARPAAAARFCGVRVLDRTQWLSL